MSGSEVLLDLAYTFSHHIPRLHRSAPRAIPGRPRAGLTGLFLASLTRLLAIAVIICVLVFGASQEVASIKTASIFGSQLDADTQLALLGLLNKLQDFLTQQSLQQTAAVLITIWMTPPNRRARQGNPGALLADLDLKDELLAPWTACICFWKRSRSHGCSWISVARFIVCLAISICVLLQGLAINTIGIPKERWYPNNDTDGYSNTEADKKAMTISTPRQYLQDINWWNYYGQGQLMDNTTAWPAWDEAIGLSATDSYTALTGLQSAVSLPQKGWQLVSQAPGRGNDVQTWWTCLNTDFVDASAGIQTLSMQDLQGWALFNWQRANGSSIANSSFGWTGLFNMTVPSLRTTCAAIRNKLSDGALNITVAEADPATLPTIFIEVGPNAALNFSGASCHITYSQASFPQSMWITDLLGAALSCNSFSQVFDHPLSYLPETIYDYNITTHLTNAIAGALPRLDGLFLDTGVLPHLIRLSRTLQGLDGNLTSDATGLAIVIGVFSQTFFATGNLAWGQHPENPDEMIVSYPIRWQVYGSGPRLAWEWATAVVLVVILFSLIFGLLQTLLHRIQPGDWLKLSGMMISASKDEIVNLQGDIKDPKNERTGRYVVKEAALAMGSP